MSRDKISRLKPISMFPLTINKAMAAFMSVDPGKVEKRLERETHRHTKIGRGTQSSGMGSK
jgi:hypothetical protein